MPDRNPDVVPLRSPSLWVQFTSLLFIELTNWRWSYPSMLITGTLAPLLSNLALGVFARDSGPQALAYILTGNLVVSIMFGNMGAIQSHVSFLRAQGGLDYFATLPVRRSILILAMLVAFLLLSVPSLIVTMSLGAWFLNVPIQLSLLVLPVIPLCALPLAGLGALVGASVRRPEEGGSINLILTLILAGMGPVIVPPERLPAPLLFLGNFSPATYAASALRQVVLGPVTPRLALDLVVLGLLSALFFWLVGQKLDWRQEA